MNNFSAPAGRRPAIILLLLMMLAMLPELVSANKKKILTAKPETSTLAGMRAISRYSDGTYKDQSVQGMKVGTGAEETRIAVCKPAFTETVALYTDWTVTDVNYSIAGTAAIMSEPLMYWSDTTPIESVYNVRLTTITDAYLINMFQTQLESGGNYSRTAGIYLSGETPLPAANLVNLTFNVTVEKEDNLTVDAISIQQSYTGAQILTWKSSFRGFSEIYVNNVRRLSEQFTVANRVNKNTVWTDWMQTGSNEVYVKVKSENDHISVGTSNILTFSR
jgi:hypothetical protein